MKSFTEADDNSGRNAVVEALNAALRAIRETIAQKKLDPLLYKAWVGIVKSDRANGQALRFVTSLVNVVPQEIPADLKKTRTIFERRGLQLP